MSAPKWPFKDRRQVERDPSDVWDDERRAEYKRDLSTSDSQSIRTLGPRPPLSDIKGVALWYLYRAPRPLLVIAALVGVATWIRGEEGWRRGVESHMAAAPTVLTRLAFVEDKVEGVADEMRLLREEQSRQRVDQLEFYRWMAEDRGDDKRVREISRKLAVAKIEAGLLLKDEMQAAAPAEPLPRQ